MFGNPKLHNRKRRSRKRSSRSGIATVELALCLPLLALISFGSIQAGSTIMLRHQSVAIIEVATLDFMLGTVSEEDLPNHLTELSEEFNLIGATASVTPVELNNVEYIRVELTLPVQENTVSPIVVGSGTEITSEYLVYRP